MANAQRGELRFRTKHLNVDAPDIIIVKPRLPKGSEVDIHGAGEERTAQLMNWMADTVSGIEGGTLRDDYKFGGDTVGRKQLDMIDIVHICEGVSNAIRQPVTPVWSDDEAEEDVVVR